MTLGVVVLDCLPHLPFGAICPHRPHDAEYTLELQMQPHWLALEVLVEDGSGLEILAQLRFGMWLFVFPVRGDHSILQPIMSGCLTPLLEF